MSSSMIRKMHTDADHSTSMLLIQNFWCNSSQLTGFSV